MCVVLNDVCLFCLTSDRGEVVINICGSCSSEALVTVYVAQLLQI